MPLRFRSVTPELIDTLWNVNTFLGQALPMLTQELIDTLWNVNKQKKYNKRKWKGN